jgi:hypothetical protein
MVARSFVSLCFTDESIDLVLLNSSKRRAVKCLSLPLPPGLISRNEVQDQNSLSAMLKEIWKKFRVKEKSVGIVIPESSTFTKTLSLPKLDADELNEAVIWEIQNYLPMDLKDMVLDWQIIKNFEDTCQVFVVAIERGVLESYINAVAKADLFPLIVDTPSLSLVRVSKKFQGGKLILYGGGKDFTLVLADGLRILATSIISKRDLNEVGKTINYLINHYRDTKIENFLICGILETNLIKQIEARLKINAQALTVRLGGIKEEDIQKFIVSISTQLKPPYEPASPETVNLLPEYIVKKYEGKRLSLRTWGLMMIISLFMTVCLVVSSGTFFYVYQQIKILSPQLASQQTKVSGNANDIRQKVKDVNTASNLVLKIKKVSITPQEIMNQIYTAKPGPVSITEYKIDLDKGTVEVRGVAAERADLLNFKLALESNKNFGQVDLPVSSFESEKDVQFEIGFNYLPILTSSKAPSVKK